MQAPMTSAAALPQGSMPAARVPSARLFLVAGTLLAVAGAVATLIRTPAAAMDPDLARVIRCMALIKGGFAIAALAACLWRLRRPISGWRRLAYVAGPPLMAGGAIVLWSLHGLGAAALGLHIGLFTVVAAALTDADFIPALRGRRLR